MQRIATAESIEYYQQESLDAYISIAGENQISAFSSISPDNTTPFPPYINDLVRLHKLI
jgi:hypothetical protein